MENRHSGTSVQGLENQGEGRHEEPISQGQCEIFSRTSNPAPPLVKGMKLRRELLHWETHIRHSSGALSGS